jgi:hypothetical protein
MRTTKSLSVIVAAGASALVVTGGAWAKATFDPATDTGFISRGAVVANGGKDALLPQGQAFVIFNYTRTVQVSCPLIAGGTAEVATTGSGFVLFLPEVRSSGDGAISGYYVRPDDQLDGDFQYGGTRAWDLCPGGTQPLPSTPSVMYGDLMPSSLIVNGVSIPFKTP